MRYRVVVFVAAAWISSRALSAQSIASRVDGVRDGVVMMRFAARPGVCGDGNGSTWTNQRSPRVSSGDFRVCMNGPIRVSLGRADNATVSVRVFVGGAWRPSATETDLGVVPSAEAARYLIGLARDIGGRSGSDAVSAAALADSANIGAELSQLVRDGDAALDTRRQALYWLGETDIPTKELAAVYEALRPFALRQHFTYVVSQRRDDVAVDKLIEIAQHDADLEVRKQAMYWLGQTQNPKALKFLRDLITR
jgi:hypothetical protein